VIARLIFTGFAMVVILIGGMEACSNVLRGRRWTFGPQTAGIADALLGVAITLSALVSLVWLFRTWSLLETVALSAPTLAIARLLITPQSLVLWRELRPLAAVATLGSTALLCLFASWP
jgi:hypothetical protein